MNIEELLKIHEEGYDFNIIGKLCILQDSGAYLFKNMNFTDVKLLGYCTHDLILTKKGEEVLNKCVNVSKKVDNYDFVKLHQKLQTELQTLTGKKQKVINGKYSFLCNSTDLKNRLLKISKKYKLSDWNKIEKLLLQYIYKCHKANFEYVQLLEYYIEKSGSSKLASDYENFVEKEEVKQEVIEPQQIKDLF